MKIKKHGYFQTHKYVMFFHHGSHRGTVWNQTLWLHCRVSGGQGAGPLTPKPAQGSVFLRRSSWNRRRWCCCATNYRPEESEETKARAGTSQRKRSTVFTSQRLQQQSISSRHHWWMQTLFMRHKDQKAGWADWVRCSKDHLSSRTMENWCRDSAPHLDPVMLVEEAPLTNNLLLITVTCWFSLLLLSAGDHINVCNKTRAHCPSR